MSDKPIARASILDIAAYKPGKSKSPSGQSLAKLSANESPLGASPKAMEAYRYYADRLAEYPDGGATALRQAIGDVHGLDPDRIGVGAGSDEILHLLAQAYVGPGDETVMSQYGFLVYPIVTNAAGGTCIKAPETELKADVDALLDAVTEKTKIVFLANPNNPTGSYLSVDEINRLHQGLRSDILLVLDAAYAEYVDAADYQAGIELVDRAQNVVMTRTFSKIGLANLRVGWFYGPAHILDVYNRLRGPFNVNGIAQAAAEAAVRDVDFTAELKAHNAKMRDLLVRELQSNRFKTYPSQCNFVLTEFADERGFTAADAFNLLMEKGLIVREMHSYGLPNCLRISIGTEAQMKLVIQTLQEMSDHG
ncbi:histidinol-phosphate transaminase [Maritalea mediterranea]|uniref:Histidinol-phosphate aminotransferase n=1 Tax=Maritalea mediterranea TaxID=2909667 RepID=A0ABS9E950_9HYPH|nr:histidinol-phosphate transaminase [Maritalea mediterranea]MCF4099401.1 histidinol-phosphate transaminase [Maritalea mediterranea]